MNLWLNPRVCAATEVSDFDLRDLRDRRMSLYLTVSPDNLARVAPLYNLLLQQLIDQNTRQRPTAERHTVPVLVLLDEFARLGHASVIAHAFSYVAGYGLRLLPVLQSPAQLRGEYGSDLAEEIIANCAVEIAFAPKDLKVAQILSERLGVYTYEGRSRSGPTGLSRGNRSSTETDQRRPLLLPQELIQMASDRLLVLRAGTPPILGRKIVYWKERAFAARVLPPPVVAPRPLRAAAFRSMPTADAGGASGLDESGPGHTEHDLRLRLELPEVSTRGEKPLARHGASDQAVGSWFESFVDRSLRHAKREAGQDR